MFAATLAVLLIMGGGVVYAATGSGPVSACYAKKGGALRIASHCKKSEKPIRLGAAGPVGAPGAAGAPGATGATGAQGVKGDPGPAAPVPPTPHSTLVGSVSIAQTTSTTDPIVSDVYGYELGGAKGGGGSGGPGGGSPATFDPVLLYVPAGPSLPALFNALARGTSFQRLTLTVGSRTIRLKDVSLTELTRAEAGIYRLELIFGTLESLEGTTPAPAGTPIGELDVKKASGDVPTTVPVYDASWSVAHAVVPGGGGGSGSSRPDFGDLVVTHGVDAASALQLDPGLTGTRLNGVTLRLYAPGTRNVAETYTLEDAVIDAFRQYDDGTGAGASERVDLSYGQQCVKVGQTESCWDLVRGGTA